MSIFIWNMILDLKELGIYIHVSVVCVSAKSERQCRYTFLT